MELCLDRHAKVSTVTLSFDLLLRGTTKVTFAMQSVTLRSLTATLIFAICIVKIYQCIFHYTCNYIYIHIFPQFTGTILGYLRKKSKVRMSHLTNHM